MSAYTDKMVNEMTAVSSWNYDSASEYASKYGLSVRSVISKLKNLELDYTPKPVVKSAGEPRVKKSEIVSQIASIAGADPEALAGLEKADARSLTALLKALPR